MRRQSPVMLDQVNARKNERTNNMFAQTSNQTYVTSDEPHVGQKSRQTKNVREKVAILEVLANPFEAEFCLKQFCLKQFCLRQFCLKQFCLKARLFNSEHSPQEPRPHFKKAILYFFSFFSVLNFLFL